MDIERLVFFGVIVVMLGLTLFISTYLYLKTNKKLLSLIPTLGLVIIGIGVTVYLSVTEINSVGSWIGLAIMIMAIVIVITAIISLIFSFIIFYAVDKGFLGSKSAPK